MKSLITDIEEKQRKKLYSQHKKLFNAVKNFIITNQLLLYGGFALNEMMPDNDKIYDKYALPDYDCFSYNAKRHAIALANVLINQGFNYVEVKSGLHKGTYKVYAEFHTAADITQVSTHLYKYLIGESHKTRKGLLVVPVQFLKWSLHLELSRPEGSLYRWEKIFERYKRFIQTHNNIDPFLKIKSTKSVKSENYEPDVLLVLNQVYDIVKTQELPIIGNFGVGLHINPSKAVNLSCCRLNNIMRFIDVLSYSIETTIDNITDLIALPSGYEWMQTKRTKGFTEILPTRIHLYLRSTKDNSKIPLITVMKVPEECYSVKHISGYTVGTVDTILTFLYAYLMTYQYFEKDDVMYNDTLKLIKITEKYISKHLKTANSRFTSKCYGHQKTLENIRKEKWNKPGFFYRP